MIAVPVYRTKTLRTTVKKVKTSTKKITRFSTLTVTATGGLARRDESQLQHDLHLATDQRSTSSDTLPDSEALIESETIFASSELDITASQAALDPLDHSLHRRNSCPACPTSAGVVNKYPLKAGKALGNGIPCCPARKVSKVGALGMHAARFVLIQRYCTRPF